MAVVVLVISAVMWVPVLRAQPVEVDQGQLLLGGGLLLCAFLLGELFPLQIEVRRETLLVSGSELPMVVGLLLLPAWVVGLSHAVAGLIVFLFRRDNWRNILLNISLILVETGTAAAVMLALVTPDATAGLRYLAAGIGVLAGALMSAIAVGITYRLFGPAEPLSRSIGRVMITATAIVTFALIGLDVWTRGGAGGWVLAVCMAAVLAVLYRTYFMFLRQHSDLARMYGFGRQVTGVGSTVGDWETVLEQVRDQLNAEVAVLRLTDGEEQRTVAIGPDGPLTDREVPADDALLTLARTNGRAAASTDRTTKPDELQALAQRDAWDVLVVPLRSGDRDRGFLEVHDRLSRWGRFRAADGQLLETLSGHVATALDNLRLLETLRHEAYHDSITGLRNRPGLIVEIQAAAEDEHAQHAVVLLELNVLSQVNNALGHDRGERLLRAAGDRLVERLGGAGQPVARIEGDRFAILVSGQSEATLTRIGADVIEVASEPFLLDGIEVDPQPSAGIATLAPGVTTADGRAVEPTTVLQRAEMALLAAQSRPDGLEIYRPSMGELYRRRFQLVTQFRHAVEQGRIVVHYQPKVDLAARELVGVESLVRWMHPEFGLVSPAEFVAAIEATGSIDILLEHVLNTVLAQVAEWCAQQRRIAAAVNLSVRNLLSADFPNKVADALRRHGVPPSLLTFEITESSVMEDPEHSLPVLDRLHAMGVSLSIDDFGTGYSSLAYLRRLPIDEIKIDKSFVQGMGTDLGDLAIVRAIVDLGHSLGLRVVAEGVEEEAARDALREMKCDQAQGFLISRPLAPDKFEAWLLSRTVTVVDRDSPTHALRLMG